jgi:hypothetical protein
MSACRRSARTSVPPLRFRFSHFTALAQKAKSTQPTLPVRLMDVPVPTAAASADRSAPVLVHAEPDDPLDQLKQDLRCAGGFAVVNDYRSSDDAASFEDK